MTITLTDMFCGAGGSSSGAIQVPGVEVKMAANHWQLAIDTHNTNHPKTDHDCADISQVVVSRYPSTDILWASPGCTNHSQAKGRKRIIAQPDMFGDMLPDEAAERSRATMWDVPRFAEYHQYQAVIVENVVDAARWVMFPAWLQAMQLLGYDRKIVYLNSMHAQQGGLPAPQSRDRMYVVFWRKGNRAPDLDQVTRPRAWCPNCERMVAAVQLWKKPTPWGRYRAQYVYRCPSVSCRNTIVEPAWLPAAAAIDWTIPGQRIGDRPKPLAEKTLRRIEAGLRKFSGPMHLEAGGNQYDSADPKRGGDYYRIWPTTQPYRTLHTSLTKGVAVPPFVVNNVSGADSSRSTRIDDVMPSFVASGLHASLLVPVEGREGNTSASVMAALRTQSTRNETAFVVPMRNHNTSKSVSEPFDTFAAAGLHHAMVTRHNSSRGDGAEMSTPVHETLRTLTTMGHQSVTTWDVPNVDDCLFRMLEPHEIARGMAFDDGYTILGNKREQVRQAGNAVTPPAARDLIAAVAQSLEAA